jgi:hypothetical protein
MIDGVVGFDHYKAGISNLFYMYVCMYVSIAIVDSKVKQIVLFDWYELTFCAAATMCIYARVR